MPQDQIQLEPSIRSDEVQEILGMIPHWIIRWGITIFFIIVFVFIISSLILKYPEIKTASITITSANPPASVVARINAPIKKLYVKNNQIVQPDTPLILLESAANPDDIAELKKMLNSFQTQFNNHNIKTTDTFKNSYQLGQIQQAYENFKNSLFEYQQFYQFEFFKKKIISLKQELIFQKKLFTNTQAKSDILKKEYNLINQKYKQYQSLLKSGIVSTSDLNDLQTQVLQKEHALKNAQFQITEHQNRLLNLNQQISEYQINQEKEKKKVRNNLQSTLDNQISAISTWEYQHLLKSPIDGIVSFSKYWAENQNVKVGEIVISIVPEESADIVGVVLLPLEGAGKVKKGQKVNIKLSDYPFKEFGIVRGKVETKALISDEKFYSVKISLIDGLKTNYGKDLPFNKKMTGLADIITEDISLFLRLVNPLRALLKR